jgi:dTDP-4-amino-4,6-dideoxygalactose transaminase
MNQHARATIPFIDVAAQRRRLGRAVDEAVARVMAHCQFILGPEVAALEADLAKFCGARHAITCASGTDALVLVLMARGVGAGDAVLVPAFTYAATAEAVALAGAVPVFADVDETFNVNAETLARALAAARRAGLKPKAVMPVDLYGLPADHSAILDFARRDNLFVLDDAAQGFGATYGGKRLGTFGLATATSFFPAKPLGCYGDGGAIFTDDEALAVLLKSLRAHGEGADRSEHVRIGMTGRLDTIQAAVLIEKLKIFPDEIAARERAAKRYGEALAKHAAVPRVPAGRTSVWAQYTIRLPKGKREAFAAALKAEGIPTAVHYRKAMHRQEAYQRFPTADGGLPMSERLAEEVISLPMHAYLDPATQDRIIEAVKRALA